MEPPSYMGAGPSLPLRPMPQVSNRNTKLSKRIFICSRALIRCYRNAQIFARADTHLRGSRHRRPVQFLHGRHRWNRWEYRFRHSRFLTDGRRATLPLTERAYADPTARSTSNSTHRFSGSFHLLRGSRSRTGPGKEDTSS